MIDRLQQQLDINPFMPLTDAIYNIILDDITEFNYLPESKLVVTTIADELHVSRTPVKEALIRLSNEGLVEQRYYKGYYVAPFNTDNFTAYYRFRMEIEALAAREAAKHITPAELRELRAYAEALNPKNDTTFADSCQKEWTFHSAIVRFSRNPYLVYAHQNLYNDFRRYNLYIHHRLTAHTSYYEQHKFIYQALKMGNPDACEAAIRDHLFNYPVTYDKDYLHVKTLYEANMSARKDHNL